MNIPVGEIIITAAVATAIPAVYLPLHRKYSSRDRRRITNDVTISATKGLLTAGLIISILFYVAAIVSGIVCTLLAPSYATYAAVPTLGFFSALMAFGYINDKFQYSVIEDKGLNSVCIYRKDKFFPYEKIGYYRPIAMFGFAGILLFDRYGRKLFSSGAGCDLRINTLFAKLNECGVTAIRNDTVFPTREMRKTAEYKAYAKRKNIFGATIAGFVCGACFILVGGLVSGLNEPPEKFANYPVSGVVTDYEFTRDHTVTITLEDDEHSYRIYSTVYDALDKYFKFYIDCGDSIDMLIAYDKPNNVRIISQIVLNGVKFLDADDAQAAMYDNYRTGNIIAYVVLGLSAAFVAGAVAGSIYLGVKKRSPAAK